MASPAPLTPSKNLKENKCKKGSSAESAASTTSFCTPVKKKCHRAETDHDDGDVYDIVNVSNVIKSPSKKTNVVFPWFEFGILRQGQRKIERVSYFNPVMHDYLTKDLKDIINNEHQAVKACNLESDENGRLKLGDRSSFGEILEVEKSAKKMDHAAIETIRYIQLKVDLKATVSVKAVVKAQEVMHTSKCEIDKYSIQDSTACIPVSSFLPIHTIAVGEAYEFLDVVVETFANIRNLRYISSPRALRNVMVRTCRSWLTRWESR